MYLPCGYDVCDVLYLLLITGDSVDDRDFPGCSALLLRDKFLLDLVLHPQRLPLGSWTWRGLGAAVVEAPGVPLFANEPLNCQYQGSICRSN